MALVMFRSSTLSFLYSINFFHGDGVQLLPHVYVSGPLYLAPSLLQVTYLLSLLFFLMMFLSFLLSLTYFVVVIRSAYGHMMIISHIEILGHHQRVFVRSSIVTDIISLAPSITTWFIILWAKAPPSVVIMTIVLVNTVSSSSPLLSPVAHVAVWP